jgi:hypothetical protein
MKKETKMFKTKIDLDELAMREILRSASPQVYSESYIGTGNFVIEREHADQIGHILDEQFDMDDNHREKTDAECKKVFPDKIGKRFIPVRQSTKPYRFVTDETKAFNDRHYWLLCEKMGFTIHGGDMTKPHALVKDGKIVGACMFMKNDVLEKAK